MEVSESIPPSFPDTCSQNFIGDINYGKDNWY